MANIISSLFKKRRAPVFHIDEIRITPLIGGGLNHQLYIRSGEFEFTGNFDNNMHHFFEVVSHAIKFFGVKYGVITIDDEGICRPTKKGFH